MIPQFKFAFKDLKKNRSLVIIFIFQLFFSLLFLLLLSNFLLQEMVTAKAFSKVYQDSYYQFKSYLNYSISFKMDEDLDNILEHTLDGNTNAYSAFSILLTDEAKETNVVIGLGGFGELFHLDSGEKDGTEVSVLLGKNVKDYHIGDTISVGTFSLDDLTINGTLKKGAYYVDNNGIYNLDNSIVILSTWEQWKKINELDYDENIVTNIKFIDTEKAYVEKFAQDVSVINKKYDLVPMSIHDILEQKKETSNGQSVFFIFFLSIVIMICIGIYSNLMQLIDLNLREYSIHRLYGAKMKDIYIRVIIYIATIIIFTFIPMIFILKAYPFEMITYVPKLICGIFALITASIVIYPILTLSKHSIPTFLRRDI